MKPLLMIGSGNHGETGLAQEGQGIIACVDCYAGIAGCSVVDASTPTGIFTTSFIFEINIDRSNAMFAILFFTGPAILVANSRV